MMVNITAMVSKRAIKTIALATTGSAMGSAIAMVAMVARTDKHKTKAKSVNTRRGLGEVVAHVVGQVVPPQVPACTHDEHAPRACSVLRTNVGTKY